MFCARDRDARLRRRVCQNILMCQRACVADDCPRVLAVHRRRRWGCRISGFITYSNMMSYKNVKSRKQDYSTAPLGGVFILRVVYFYYKKPSIYDLFLYDRDIYLTNFTCFAHAPFIIEFKINSVLSKFVS